MSNLVVTRLKRFTSKAEREKNPGWRNPGNLDPGELADLDDLYANRANKLKQNELEEADKAGTVMFVAYDKADLTRSQNGRIVGFLSLTIAIIPGRKRAYINEIRIDAEHHALVSETLMREAGVLCEELGIGRSDIDVTSRVQNMRRVPRRSGVLEVVERMEGNGVRRDADEDGPSTSQMRIPSGERSG